MGASDYIRNIRTRIGHEYLLLPGATALIRDDAGRVLLARTADFGLWGTIGGSVDPDEPPADAARREAFEEVGVEVEIVGLIAAVGGPAYRMTYPNGDVCGYVGSVFEARIVAGTPRADGDEMTEVGWFSPEELAAQQIEPLSRQLLIDIGLLTA